MSITRALHRNAVSNPQGTSSRFGPRVKTWQVTRDRVAAMAGGLFEHGLRSGERVAVFSSNSDLYFELVYATSWAGGVIVPLNTRWSVSELIFALLDCGASYLAVDKASTQLGFRLIGAIPRLRLLGIDWSEGAVLDCAKFAEDCMPLPDTRADDFALCSIFYTGGTTGRSRGVMLTHGNHCFNSVAPSPIQLP
jgi:long-chain acyl-CoA synthetase